MQRERGPIKARFLLIFERQEKGKTNDDSCLVWKGRRQKQCNTLLVNGQTNDWDIDKYFMGQQQTKGAKEASGTLWLVGTLWLPGLILVARVSL